MSFLSVANAAKARSVPPMLFETYFATRRSSIASVLNATRATCRELVFLDVF